MQWFKDHTALRHNKKYRRLSDRARQAFDNAMRAAAEYEQGDSLATDLGPLDEEELAYDLVVKPKHLAAVLSELQTSGFFVRDGSVWRIAKFEEKAGTSTDRVRKHREMKRRETVSETSDETPNETPQGTPEKHVPETGYTRSREIEIEIDVANATSPQAARQSKLPLVDESTLAARAILAAIWPRVSTSLAGVMTKTEWGKQNIRYARDLVAAGASLDAVVAAHATASSRLGAPVRMLNIVQSEMANQKAKPSPYSGLRVVGKD